LPRIRLRQTEDPACGVRLQPRGVGHKGRSPLHQPGAHTVGSKGGDLLDASVFVVDQVSRPRLEGRLLRGPLPVFSVPRAVRADRRFPFRYGSFRVSFLKVRSRFLPMAAVGSVCRDAPWDGASFRARAFCARRMLLVGSAERRACVLSQEEEKRFLPRRLQGRPPGFQARDPHGPRGQPPVAVSVEGRADLQVPIGEGAPLLPPQLPGIDHRGAGLQRHPPGQTVQEDRRHPGSFLVRPDFPLHQGGQNAPLEERVPRPVPPLDRCPQTVPPGQGGRADQVGDALRPFGNPVGVRQQEGQALFGFRGRRGRRGCGKRDGSERASLQTSSDTPRVRSTQSAPGMRAR
jgi:hypothetical protein